MTRSQSEAGIGSEFRSEQSYQISEGGNRIGLGINLCVAPTRTICGYVLLFQTVVGDWSRTRVRQGSEYRGIQLSDE